MRPPAPLACLSCVSPLNPAEPTGCPPVRHHSCRRALLNSQWRAQARPTSDACSNRSLAGAALRQAATLLAKIANGRADRRQRCSPTRSGCRQVRWPCCSHHDCSRPLFCCLIPTPRNATDTHRNAYLGEHGRTRFCATMGSSLQPVCRRRPGGRTCPLLLVQFVCFNGGGSEGA